MSRPRTHAPVDAVDVLGDFTAIRRLISVSALAAGLGLVGALLAKGLLSLIALSTNLFFFGRFSTTDVTPVDAHLGGLMLAIPVIGGLIIGVMARYGSERIRGHGIPEAIEAILMNGSRVQDALDSVRDAHQARETPAGRVIGCRTPRF